MLQNQLYYLKIGDNYAKEALRVAVVRKQEWGEGGLY